MLNALVLNITSLVVIALCSFASLAANPQNKIAQNSGKDAQSQVITIAFSEISYPQQFINEQGQPDGVMKDIWQLWAERQGVEIQFVPFSDWNSTISSVLSGKVDFHAGLTKLPERETVLDFTETIYPNYSYIYINRDLPQISEINQLTPYTIGVVKGASHTTTVQKANPKIKIVAFDNRHALYQAALDNEIFAFAELDQLDEKYQKLTELNVKYPRYRRLNYKSNDYGAAVTKGNTKLQAFINEGLAKISLAEKQSIREKWQATLQVKEGLVFSFTDNLPPYMGHSLSGQPQGLYIDIWRLWSKYSGTAISFVGESMSRSIELVKEGKVDAHVAYPDVVQETKELDRAVKVFQLHSQVFVAKHNKDIKRVEELSGKAVGLFPTSPYVEQLKAQYPDITLTFFTSHIDMIRAAEKQEIDAVITEVENMKVKLVNANLQSLFYLLDEPTFDINMFAMVRADNTALSAYIQEGFNKIPYNELQALERTWLSEKGNSYFSTLSNRANLNEEQQLWVKNNPTLKVGAVKNWEPLEFAGENGEVKGINKDIAEAVATSVGLSIRFTVFDNWSSMFNAFRREEVDVILGVSNNAHNRRDALLDFSDVYWEMPWSIIHKQSFDDVKSIKDFYGKQLAVVKGYQIIERIRADHPSVYITVVDTVEEGILAVQKNLVDGFIEALPVASKLTARESIVPLTISLVPEIPLEPNTIALRKGNELLKSILNKGLEQIDESKRQEIFDSWFNVHIKTGLDQRWVTKVAAQISFIILVVIGIVIYWNRKLRQEVSRRKLLEEQMKHMATHDELTGIANRNLMKTQMEQAIAMHQRQHIKLAVLFIDLDGFKAVNDQFGHNFGDSILKEVSSRLKVCIRKSDTVCRFGGDEFVLLLTGLNNREEAAFIAEKIIDAVGKPYENDEATAHLGCSIGIAMFPEDGDNESDLLKMADTLMYRVKASGKNNYLYR